MNLRRCFRHLIVGVTVAILAGVIFIRHHGRVDQLFGFFLDQQHLSDDEALTNFHRHRPEFEQLREMITHDKGLMQVADDWTLPKDLQSINIESMRIAQYLCLMKDLGIKAILISNDRKNIEMTSSNRGFITHGSSKGYLYIDAPVNQNLMAELDHLSASGVGFGLRLIEGNWYLSFEGY